MEHTVATSMSTKFQKFQRYDLDMFEVQRGYSSSIGYPGAYLKKLRH